MYGILFQEDETGEKIRCGVCNKEAEEGYHLETVKEEEYNFLKFMFQDISNWTVNRCCLDKFEKECSNHGFDLELRDSPPDEVMNKFNEDNYLPLPSHLSKNISTEHEFYIITTKNGDKIWGFLYRCNGSSFEMNNCYKFNLESSNWDRVGYNDESGKYQVSISTNEIESVEQAPYFAKNDDDYGFKIIKDK